MIISFFSSRKRLLQNDPKIYRIFFIPQKQIGLKEKLKKLSPFKKKPSKREECLLKRDRSSSLEEATASGGIPVTGHFQDGDKSQSNLATFSGSSPGDDIVDISTTPGASWKNRFFRASLKWDPAGETEFQGPYSHPLGWKCEALLKAKGNGWSRANLDGWYHHPAWLRQSNGYLSRGGLVNLSYQQRSQISHTDPYRVAEINSYIDALRASKERFSEAATGLFRDSI